MPRTNDRSGCSAAGAEGEDERRPVRLGGPQPGPSGDEVSGVGLRRPEDVPQVPDRRRREHVVGRDRVADPLPDGGGERFGQLGEPLVRGDEQPQLGQLGEEPAGPAGPRGRHLGQPAQRARDPWCLGVDHPGGHAVEPAVGVGRRPGDAGPHLVVQPDVELGQPARHALLSPGRRARGLLRVLRCGRAGLALRRPGRPRRPGSPPTRRRSRPARRRRGPRRRPRAGAGRARACRGTSGSGSCTGMRGRPGPRPSGTAWSRCRGRAPRRGVERAGARPRRGRRHGAPGALRGGVGGERQHLVGAPAVSPRREARRYGVTARVVGGCGPGPHSHRFVGYRVGAACSAYPTVVGGPGVY